MPEYTFNPATGQSEETRNGAPIEGITEPSLQERSDAVQANLFRQTSQHLADRAFRKSQGVATDETPGLGTLKTELKLQQVQQQLFEIGDTDPTKSALLQHEAQQLAELLTTGTVSSPADAVSETDSPEETFADAIRAEKGSEAVDATLQWAADNLDSGASEVLNEVFEGEHAEVAYEALERMQANPEMVGSGETTPIDQAEVNQLEDLLGAEAAHTIATLNAALVAGKASKGDVLGLAMSTPNTVGRWLMQAAEAGIIRLSL